MKMLFVPTVLSIQEKSETSSKQLRKDRILHFRRHSAAFILRPFKISVKVINVPKDGIVEYAKVSLKSK